MEVTMNKLDKHLNELRENLAPLFIENEEAVNNSLAGLRAKFISGIEEKLALKKIYEQEKLTIIKILNEKCQELYGLLIISFPEVADRIVLNKTNCGITKISLGDHSYAILFEYKYASVDSGLEIHKYEIPEKPIRFNGAYFSSTEELLQHSPFHDLIEKYYKIFYSVKERQK
jgi:hypothetical protein